MVSISNSKVLNNYDTRANCPYLPAKNPLNLFKVTNTHLMLPRAALAGCVRAYVSRNTQGIELAPNDRLNHYPASPLCTLAWSIRGEGVLVSKGGVPLHQNVPERVLLMGPQTMPSVTQNIGEVHGLMVFLMPDALQALTGINLAELLDTYAPVEQVLDVSWQRMANEVLTAHDDLARIQCIESFLLPRWEACRASAERSPDSHTGWITHLMTRAALSGVGKSTRQLERRVKLWAGQSMQKLRGMARAETSFFAMRDASEREMLSWAELAFNAGFSDQAHMCREIRRITGFSPDEVRCAINNQESFWIYRLWH